MIHGAHAIIFSKDADADRAFFRDVLKYRFADAGHGWLIFALPPAELAFHPSDEGGTHELYLMCDDVKAFVAEMKAKGVATSPLHEERWGILTQISLPSGGKLGVYEPRHASPLASRGKPAAKRGARKSKSKSKSKSKKGPAKKKGAKPARTAKKRARSRS